MSLFDLSDDEDLIEQAPPAQKASEKPASVPDDDLFSDDEEFSQIAATASVVGPVKNNQNGGIHQYDDESVEMNDAEQGLPKGYKMSQSEKLRSEKNKLKALNLKKSRLMTRPNSQAVSKMVSQQPKLVDTGGGFFIEEEEETENAVSNKQKQIAEELGPILPHEQPSCQMCQGKFSDSYLFRTFDHVVCDNCRDMGKDGEHELITKTTAKSTFLLKDFHLEECEHGLPLKFITRKNPHSSRGGGDMKLYLRLQVEERALKVWGSEENLQNELESREDKKVAAKAKKYTKQMKELRMAARSSLYKKVSTTHTHEYTNEVYHPDKDEYSQTCNTCGHINTYEKL